MTLDTISLLNLPVADAIAAVRAEHPEYSPVTTDTAPADAVRALYPAQPEGPDGVLDDEYVYVRQMSVALYTELAVSIEATPEDWLDDAVVRAKGRPADADWAWELPISDLPNNLQSTLRSHWLLTVAYQADLPDPTREMRKARDTAIREGIYSSTDWH